MLRSNLLGTNADESLQCRGPAATLRILETLAALEPSQTRRSEEQLKYQQFSTPLPLAYAALQAAMIRPGDVVLEPSAGNLPGDCRSGQPPAENPPGQA